MTAAQGQHEDDPIIVVEYEGTFDLCWLWPGERVGSAGDGCVASVGMRGRSGVSAILSSSVRTPRLGRYLRRTTMPSTASHISAAASDSAKPTLNEAVADEAWISAVAKKAVADAEARPTARGHHEGWDVSYRWRWWSRRRYVCVNVVRGEAEPTAQYLLDLGAFSVRMERTT